MFNFQIGNNGEAVPVDLSENLVAHYILNNNSDDSVGVYDGTDVATVDYTGDYLDPLVGSVTIPDSTAASNSYWKDTGAGMTFVYSTTTVTSLATDNYSNLRMYSDTKSTSFQAALEAEGYYPKPLPLPTTTGLIAHYPLTGTAEDVTGNYDGTENGNTYIDDVEFGSAASFSNLNYITGAVTSTVSSQVTISCWFKTSTTGIYQTILSDSPEDGALIGRRITIGLTNAQEFMVSLGDGTNSWNDYTVSSSLYHDGLWHFIALRINGTSVDLYVDDTLVNAYTSTISLSVAGARPHSIGYLGEYFDAGTRFEWEGELMSLRYYNDSLSETEITDIYNYEKNFRSIDIDDGLVAYYPLANNSLDNYYNEYDGTDTSVTYDGSEATITGSIVFPAAAGFVEAYYTHNGTITKTITESVLNSLTGTLSEVRKYNSALSTEQQLIIGYTA